MLRRLFLVAPIVFAILAIFLSRKTPLEPIPKVTGRNNTVLFLTSDASGLSNAHIAVSSALLENHPNIEVHYASFPKLQSTISRISSAARKKNPTTKTNPIQWHELPEPGILEVWMRRWNDTDGMISELGAKDYDNKAKDMAFTMAPWEADEHWNIYKAIIDVVDKVDPALVVLDNMFVPAKDFANNNNRPCLTISPNGLVELIAVDQPWAAMFWKYPAASTGLPYPISWRMLPTNLYLHFKLISSLVTSSMLSSKREYLISKGIQDPLALSFVVKGAPLLTSAIPEADFPMKFIPPHVKFCGPIAIDVTLPEEQSQIVLWMKQAPTILINLGSMFKYNEQRAGVMSDALGAFLSESNFQVLWKFEKLGNYSDAVLSSVQQHIDSGRLKMERWLEADPTALLQSGHIVLSVHHGGANCYHEAVLAGVPQLVLPLWFDLFNFANAAEYRGIGVWPGKDIAPEWGVDSLLEGFRTTLSGPRSVSLRQKAQALGEVASSYGGRKTAAAEIARLAVVGEESSRVGSAE